MPTVRGAFDWLTRYWAPAFAKAHEAHSPPYVYSMLYVGHRADTHPWWWQTFAPACNITNLAVIDIVKANAETASHITKDIYVGDIRTAPVPPFDLVFWDEGPEHLPREESLSLIQGLAARHTTVLVSCPWGYQPQGSGPTDVEFHHWGPQPVDFESIGMQTAVFGTEFDGRGNGHGNLIAWMP